MEVIPDIPLITPQTLGSALGIKNYNTIHKIIVRNHRTGILKQLTKGKYILASKVISEFTIANLIKPLSYVSFESALSYYGILSQFTYIITSATPKKTRHYQVGKQTYEYSQITPNLYWGFVKTNDFLIAEPEKALIDTLYLTSKKLRHLDVSELDLSSINHEKFNVYCQKINNLPFQKLIASLKI